MVLSKNVSNQSGVAIWYILAGIALFAALSYSFVRSVNQSQSGTSKEQSKIAASGLLRYMNALEQGIQKLTVVHGCSENTISFYSELWATPTDYDNANNLNAGGDFNCFIYQGNGGGVSWDTFGDLTLNGEAQDVYVSSAFAVEDIGTAAPELIFFARTNVPTCDEINRQAGIGTSNDVNGVVSTYAAPFVGAYSLTDTIGDAAAHSDLAGESYGCFIDGNDHYVFYGVISER